jgi:hypothetical protein
MQCNQFPSSTLGVFFGGVPGTQGRCARRALFNRVGCGLPYT